MNCPECGNPVAEEERFCRKCYTIIEPPSLWRRFLAMFQPTIKTRDVQIIKKVVTKQETVTYTDPQGQRHVYHSLEEVPPELRAKIEAARAEALKKGQGTSQTFTVRDASGIEHIYHSLEEMPPYIRAMVEQIRSESGSV